MYRAETFLKGAPMFQGGIIEAMEREGCFPFDAGKIDEFSYELSSGEQQMIKLGLCLFNPHAYPCNIGALMATVSNDEDLKYVAQWVGKGCQALD